MTAESRRTVCMRHHAPESTATKKIVKLRQPDYQAIVLHPSLGCPLLIADKRKVSIILAGNVAFEQTFRSGAGNCQTGGSNIKLVLAQCLKVMTWEDATNFEKDPTLIPPLYKADRETAFENITCTALGPIEIQLKNRAGEHFANIRGATKKTLKDIGMTHLYQVDLTNLPDLKDDKMYDICWIGANSRAEAHDFNETYLDPQDRMLRRQVMKSFYKYKNKEDGAPGEAPQYAYKVNSEMGLIFEPDTSTPLLARHPIYVVPAGKDKLTIGHLSDIHVSSRQNAFKGRSATVIPGVVEKISPPIGDQANNNCENFFDLLNQFGNKTEGVDLLVITGDLYDHLHNYDPAFKRTAKTSRQGSTGQLWEAMYLEKDTAVHQRNEEYPCGIDALMVYSLIIHYYNTYKKPVFMTSGNHEAYEYPYGISPRLFGKRANAGIPLDHNLTFYEAILLYGPGYSKILKKYNFAAGNLDWFYNIFTPLTDCVIRYGDQCLIGLGWGDDEDISVGAAISEATNLMKSETGTLPRANRSINAAQKNLVESALVQQGRDNIFCSHFTLVNYGMDTPLAEAGKVMCDSSTSQYEHGTVTEGRETLHGAWLGRNVFQLALGGHSHRAGLYKCLYTPHKWDYQLNTQIPGFLQTNGYHPDSIATQQVAWEKHTKVLVSASTGPIPKQNLNGEMCGTGMELPSGTRINPDGTLVLKKCRVKTARPRFCVACDYIDVLKDGFWEYFRAVDNDGTFEMKPYWHKIHPKLNEHTKAEMIESVMLYVVGSDGTNCVAANKVKKSNYKMLFGDAVRWKFEADLSSELEFYGKNSPTMFLSLKFNSSAFKGLSGFGHYDFNSPWNIQIEIFNKIYEDRLQEVTSKSHLISGLSGGYEAYHQVEAMNKRKKENPLEDLAIRRHKDNGEIPDFEWRMANWPIEFSNITIKQKKKA